MTVNKLVLGRFETNCYIVAEGGKAFVVDPADDGASIKEALSSWNLSPEFVILTHYHWDHVLGLGAFRDLPIYIGAKDAAYFSSDALYSSLSVFGPRMSAAYGEILRNLPSPTAFLKEGDEIGVPGAEFKVIETPGHSAGSISLYNKNDGVLISGDTLFEGGIGRTDLPGGSASEIASALKKLSVLPPETIVYPGHGGATTIGRELFG